MPDDAFELEVLRDLRDTYLMPSDELRGFVEHYYEVSPKIVAAIERSRNPKAVYDEVFERLILPTVEAALSGQKEKACDIGKSILREFEERFLK